MPGTEVAEVVVTGDPREHPRVLLRSALLAPRLLGTDIGGARIALVATTATLLAGDVMRLRVDVGAGLRVDLEDIAATVAYNGRGGQARWDICLEVRKRATLVWQGKALVVADGADVVRTLRVDVAEGGRLLMRDVVVLGRHQESGGSLRCDTRASYAGQPLLVEQLDLVDRRAGLRFTPGVIGEHRVVDTVTWLGEPLPCEIVPDSDQVTRLDLAGPGLVARHLASATHASPLDLSWDRLTQEIARPTA